MRVALWADGSATVGAGHLIRSRLVGQALLARGHDVRWLTPTATGPASWAWQDLDFELAAAPPRQGYDLLLGDGNRARGPVLRPAVWLHDRPAGPHPEVDLVIDAAARAADYPSVPACLGPDYRLLQDIFFTTPWRGGDGLLIVPGGTDATDLLPTLATALSVDQRQAATVVGCGDGKARGLGFADGLGSLTAPELAQRMAGAAACLVTASTVAWEALAVGCPVVAVEVVANQADSAAALRALGVPVLSRDDLSHLAEHIAQAKVCPAPIDGQAAERVADRIEDLRWTQQQSVLRLAHFGDARQLYDWAIDPAVAKSRLRPAEITWQGHRRWLAATLSDADSRLFLAEDSHGPCGTVRLTRRGHVATVSITVAPQRRGQGMGPRLLAALQDFASCRRFAPRLRALIRHHNTASLACFEKAGYQPLDDVEPGICRLEKIVSGMEGPNNV